MSFVKGICIGVIVGAGIGLAADMSPARKKRGRKMLCRCMRSLGDVFEGVSTVLGV